MLAVTPAWIRKKNGQVWASFRKLVIAPAIAPAIMTLINLFMAGRILASIYHLAFRMLTVNADNQRKMPEVMIPVMVHTVLLDTE